MTDVPQPRCGQLRKQRIQIFAWTAVLIPFFAMAILRWDDGPGFDAGDYAHYLLHARALAEGRSYTDTGYIFSEHAWIIGPRAQPPGLPVTLAPFLMMTGENLIVLRLVMLAFATAFVFGAGRYFARREDPVLGLGVSLLVGASVPISQASLQILSDLPLHCSWRWRCRFGPRESRSSQRFFFSRSCNFDSTVGVRPFRSSYAPRWVQQRPL
jgi:hypothetical protein